MSRLILMLWAAALVVVSTDAHAGCKAETDVDIDGNQQTKMYLFEQTNGSMGIIKGDKLLLHLPIWQVGAADGPMVPGGETKILLEDGNAITLVAPEGVVPKSAVWGSQILTTWNPKFEVTQEQLALLAASRIRKMQVPLAGQAIDLDATTGIWKFMAKKTEKLAACWVEKGP